MADNPYAHLGGVRIAGGGGAAVAEEEEDQNPYAHLGGVRVGGPRYESQDLTQPQASNEMDRIISGNVGAAPLPKNAPSFGVLQDPSTKPIVPYYERERPIPGTEKLGGVPPAYPTPKQPDVQYDKWGRSPTESYNTAALRGLPLLEEVSDPNMPGQKEGLVDYSAQETFGKNFGRAITGLATTTGIGLEQVATPDPKTAIPLVTGPHQVVEGEAVGRMVAPAVQAVGKGLQEIGKYAESFIPPDSAAELAKIGYKGADEDLSQLLNPHYMAKLLGSTAGSMVGFLAPQTALFRYASWAQKGAAAAGLWAVSEALSNGGEIYQEAIDSGYTPYQAHDMLMRSLAPNLLSAFVLHKAGIMNDKISKPWLQKGLGMLGESAEEIQQNATSNYMFGRPLSKGWIESGVGGLAGGLIGSGIAGHGDPQIDDADKQAEAAQQAIDAIKLYMEERKKNENQPLGLEPQGEETATGEPAGPTGPAAPGTTETQAPGLFDQQEPPPGEVTPPPPPTGETVPPPGEVVPPAVTAPPPTATAPPPGIGPDQSLPPETQPGTGLPFEAKPAPPLGEELYDAVKTFAADRAQVEPAHVQKLFGVSPEAAQEVLDRLVADGTFAPKPLNDGTTSYVNLRLQAERQGQSPITPAPRVKGTEEKQAPPPGPPAGEQQAPPVETAPPPAPAGEQQAPPPTQQAPPIVETPLPPPVAGEEAGEDVPPETVVKEETRPVPDAATAKRQAFIRNRYNNKPENWYGTLEGEGPRPEWNAVVERLAQAEYGTDLKGLASQAIKEFRANQSKEGPQGQPKPPALGQAPPPATAAPQSVIRQVQSGAPPPAKAQAPKPTTRMQPKEGGGYEIVPVGDGETTVAAPPPPPPGEDQTSLFGEQEGAAPPQQSGIVRMNPNEIEADPVRFQFKRDTGGKAGVGEELKDPDVPWNEELGGVLTVWRDPANGKTYVVNGHHRLEKAQRMGVAGVDVRYIEAKDAQQARAKGALQNIAEGRGTSIDAAKFMRDTGLTPDDMKAFGVHLKGERARQGVALSKLPNRLFEQVLSGDLKVERAVIIGEGLDNHSDMLAVAEASEKLNDAQLREMIRRARGGARTEETQVSLFGEDVISKSLIKEEAILSEAVRKQLSQEKRLFATVGTKGAATTLERGGNVIATEQNRQIADAAAQALEIYDRLSTHAGPVADALAAGARELAGGANLATVKENTYAAVRSAVQTALRGGEAPSREGTAAVDRGRAPSDGGERGSQSASGETRVGEPPPPPKGERLASRRADRALKPRKLDTLDDIPAEIEKGKYRLATKGTGTLYVNFEGMRTLETALDDRNLDGVSLDDVEIAGLITKLEEHLNSKTLWPDARKGLERALAALHAHRTKNGPGASIAIVMAEKGVTRDIKKTVREELLHNIQRLVRLTDETIENLMVTPLFDKAWNALDAAYGELSVNDAFDEITAKILAGETLGLTVDERVQIAKEYRNALIDQYGQDGVVLFRYVKTGEVKEAFRGTEKAKEGTKRAEGMGPQGGLQLERGPDGGGEREAEGRGRGGGVRSLPPVSVEPVGKITKFIRNLRGGSQAKLVQASNGKHYVVKFFDNPQGSRVPINELIAGRLFHALGLKTPLPVVLDYDGSNFDISYASGPQRYQVKGGQAIGTEFVVDPDSKQRVYDQYELLDSQVAETSNVTDIQNALVIDKWLGNSDSRQVVFHEDSSGTGFIATLIDHGYVFNGPYWNFTKNPHGGLYVSKVVYDQVRSMEDFRDMINRIKKLDPEYIREIFRQIPDNFESKASTKERMALAEAIIERRNNLEPLLQAMADTGWAFRKWGTPKAKPTQGRLFARRKDNTIAGQISLFDWAGTAATGQIQDVAKDGLTQAEAKATAKWLDKSDIGGTQEGAAILREAIGAAEGQEVIKFEAAEETAEEKAAEVERAAEFEKAMSRLDTLPKTPKARKELADRERAEAEEKAETKPEGKRGEQLKIDIEEEQPDYQAQLQGDRLTAAFASELSPEEKRRKLKPAEVEQESLFGGGEVKERSGRLFARRTHESKDDPDAEARAIKGPKPLQPQKQYLSESINAGLHQFYVPDPKNPGKKLKAWDRGIGVIYGNQDFLDVMGNLFSMGRISGVNAPRVAVDKALRKIEAILLHPRLSVKTREEILKIYEGLLDWYANDAPTTQSSMSFALAEPGKIEASIIREEKLHGYQRLVRLKNSTLDALMKVPSFKKFGDFLQLHGYPNANNLELVDEITAKTLAGAPNDGWHHTLNITERVEVAKAYRAAIIAEHGDQAVLLFKYIKPGRVKDAFLGKERTTGQKVSDKVEDWVVALNERAAEATKRFNFGQHRFVKPTRIRDMASIIAADLANNTLNATNYVAKIVDRFGAGARPVARQVYLQAQAVKREVQAIKEREQTSPSVAKETAAKEATEDVRAAAGPQALTTTTRQQQQQQGPPAATQQTPRQERMALRERNKGLRNEPKETRYQKLKGALVDIKDVMTRQYSELPGGAKFAEIRQRLNFVSKSQGTAIHKAAQAIIDQLEKLSADEYSTFIEVIVYNDLAARIAQQTAETGKSVLETDLPLGIKDKFHLFRVRADARVEARANPKITAALNMRAALWPQIRKDYINAMKKAGADISKAVSRKDYFRHRVWKYQDVKEAGKSVAEGGGHRFKLPTLRSWLKKSEVNAHDYSLDYIKAEFEVLSEMMYDTSRANFIGWLKNESGHNIAKQLMRRAAAHNKAVIMPTMARMARFHNRKNRGRGVSMLTAEAMYQKMMSLKPRDPSWRKRLTMRLAGAKYVGSLEKALSTFASETHELYQAEKGHHFFLKPTIDDALAQAIETNGMGTVTADKIKRMKVRGVKKGQMVLPKEIIKTLNEFMQGPTKKVDKLTNTIFGAPIGWWKQSKLIHPISVLKYNIRNLSGDLERVLAVNPHAMVHVGVAVKDILSFVRTGHMPSPQFKAWWERGGMDSNLQVAEMGDVNKLRELEHLAPQATGTEWATNKAVKYWRTVWHATRTATDVREGILRYATFLEYQQQIANSTNGRPKNFGASRRDEVMALRSRDDRAYKLSNDLMLAYDEVSAGGQQIRRKLIPFWSFQEKNAQSYKRIVQNAWADGRESAAIGHALVGGAGAAARIGVYGMMKTARMSLRLAALKALTELWNNYAHDDEEEDLPEGVKKSTHIILGRDENNKVLVFSRLGTLDDLLEWGGFDALPYYAREYMNGRMTFNDLVSETFIRVKGIPTLPFKPGFNKVVQGLTPYFKIPAELLAGKTFFPDVFKSRELRDRGEYIARELGALAAYKGLISKKPQPKVWTLEKLMDFVVYRYDPGETHYNSFRYDKVAKWGVENGVDMAAGGLSHKKSAEALYDFRMAVRYDDQDALVAALNAYKDAGGTRANLKKSLDRLHPLGALTNKKIRAEFKASLTPQELHQLEKAEAFWEEHFHSREEELDAAARDQGLPAKKKARR